MPLPEPPLPYLSVIVCVYNEVGNIRPLVTQIQQALAGISYELIYVNDGSTDQTLTELRSVAAPNLIILDLQKNYGQSLALAAGIEAARGEFIATLDGDQQNDPADIPNLLAYCVVQDLDFVSGVRAKRQDGFWLRKLPSRLANSLIRWATAVKLRDLGCGLKVLRIETARQLGLYGELHRLLAVLAQLEGGRLGELPVNHRPRQIGQSKYGLNRTFKVISDLLLLLFLKKYARRPMHLFGTAGVVMLMIGVGLLFVTFFTGNILFTNSVIFILGGFHFIMFGILLEMMIRSSRSQSNQSTYRVRTIYRTTGEISPGN